MNIDEIIQVINLNTEKKLTPLQETILRQTWEGKTYLNIANDLHYKQEYIRRVASNLWNLLTKVWQIRIGKNNFRCTLEPKQLTDIEKDLLQKVKTEILIKYISYPDHPLNIESPLYIQRPPLERLAKEEIVKPASLIRIKAPQKYGKNSLILQLFKEAKKLNYNTVTIDFKQADKSFFSDIDKLLRWLSLNIARELNISREIEDYWNYDIGTKVSCSIYLQEAILEQLEYPLVLALNEVNRLFEYPDLADDFFSLLRYWYEQGQRLKTWEKLRLIVAYSTDIYIPLNLNHSPFNIGLSLNLKPFNLEQIKILIQRYGLDFISELQIKNLLTFLGGHPYLTQITLYKLFQANSNQQNLSLKDILDNALNNKSIYQTHLQISFNSFKIDHRLKDTFSTIINSPNINSQNLDKNLIKKLDDMGLIIWDKEKIIPTCLLYVQYFLKEFTGFSEPKISPPPLFTSNTLENQELLLSLDPVTPIYDRLRFDEVFDLYWRQLTITQQPLAIIFCDCDFYGKNAANLTLEKKELLQNQIATILAKNMRNSRDIIALYQDTIFAIILPNADSYFAFQIAAKIRDKIRDLNPLKIFNINPISEKLTVSLGLTSLIPNSTISPTDFLEKTAIALSEAQNNGGDQVTISSVYAHGLIDHPIS